MKISQENVAGRMKAIRNNSLMKQSLVHEQTMKYFK